MVIIKIDSINIKMPSKTIIIITETFKNKDKKTLNKNIITGLEFWVKNMIKIFLL